MPITVRRVSRTGTERTAGARRRRIEIVGSVVGFHPPAIRPTDARRAAPPVRADRRRGSRLGLIRRARAQSSPSESSGNRRARPTRSATLRIVRAVRGPRLAPGRPASSSSSSGTSGDARRVRPARSGAASIAAINSS